MSKEAARSAISQLAESKYDTIPTSQPACVIRRDSLFGRRKRLPGAHRSRDGGADAPASPSQTCLPSSRNSVDVSDEREAPTSVPSPPVLGCDTVSPSGASSTSRNQSPSCSAITSRHCTEKRSPGTLAHSTVRPRLPACSTLAGGRCWSRRDRAVQASLGWSHRAEVGPEFDVALSGIALKIVFRQE